MDLWVYVRLLAHTLLIVEAVTAAYMVWLARGESVRIVKVGWAIAGLALITLWLVGLLFSVKAVEFVPRAYLAPLLATLEGGAGVMFGAWLIAMYRSTFRMHLTTRDRVAAVLIAFTVLRVS